MDKLGYIVVLCVLHVKVFCHTQDESIIIHSLKKRDIAEQLGPIPYRQREEAPQPITDASQGTESHVYGHTAVLNSNLQEENHNPQSSIAGGSSSSYASRTPLYRQYTPDRTQGDAQAPTYDYRQSSSQSYRSQGRSTGYSSGGAGGSDSGSSFGSQTGVSQRPSRTHNSQGNEADGTDASQGNTGSSRTRSTPTDPRYTDPRYQGTGATATYSPTGTRRRDNTRVSSGTSTRYHSQGTGSTGPTGRRQPVAATYPLGPILSSGGVGPAYTNRQQTNTGSQVHRQTPGYRGTYTSQPVYTGGGQTYYTSGRQTYTGSRQPVYTSGGQPVYTAGGQPVYTAGGQPYYSGTNQYGYTGGQQPVYNVGGQGSYNPNCPETGIRMRINGMDCARAVDVLGAFLCYRHEATSRECCEKCQPLKNANRVGCEYGDHSHQCRQIQAHDCYDLRNRQSCCETCDRLRISAAAAGCEYGDMTPRCERVGQSPSLCYIPDNQRLCCSTCRRLRGESQTCPWGDQNSNLCRPFDQYGGVRINCYNEPIRRLCCQTCDRLRSRMPAGVYGCEYGDRPVIFNTGAFGSLNCTSFFRHFPVEQCQLNQAVSINCCYTCHRYTSGRQRQSVRRQGQGQGETGRG